MTDPNEASGQLEFRHVVKYFRLGGEVVRAVDDVSLTVGAGELVALLGPSGSGKSTLLSIAAAIERPDSGAVSVGGREVSSLSERQGADYRSRQLGFIQQKLDLMDGATAVENAALKLGGAGLSRRAAHKKVIPLLEDLGLGDRLKHRPSQLSMGERQRVVIARALSTDPQVVLADEPTASLDIARTGEVLELLRTITKTRGVATLLVTHDPHAAEFADRVLTLQDGVLHDGDIHTTTPRP